jgi:Protein of unknown function (DUF3500)
MVQFVGRGGSQLGVARQTPMDNLAFRDGNSQKTRGTGGGPGPMGTPSATEPWGFQFDGHHLVVNYFVLGDQVVMSPCFWGSEPTSLDIDGETVSVCQEEVEASLAFIQSLTAAQQKTAVISATKADEDMKAGAFADNAVEAYAGIRATALTSAQKKKLLVVAERS